MFTDLWEKVREHLPSARGIDRFEMTHHGSRWEDQSVDLKDEDLIVRIVRERGAYEVRFLTVGLPSEWYSLNEVLSYLGLPRQPLVPPLEVDDTLRELRQLLDRDGETLRRAFDRGAFMMTRQRLLELREAEREAQRVSRKPRA